MKRPKPLPKVTLSKTKAFQHAKAKGYEVEAYAYNSGSRNNLKRGKA